MPHSVNFGVLYVLFWYIEFYFICECFMPFSFFAPVKLLAIKTSQSVSH